MAKSHEEKSYDQWLRSLGLFSQERRRQGETSVCHNGIHTQSKLCSVLQNHVKRSLDRQFLRFSC